MFWSLTASILDRSAALVFGLFCRLASWPNARSDLGRFAGPHSITFLHDLVNQHSLSIVLCWKSRGQRESFWDRIGEPDDTAGKMHENRQQSSWSSSSCQRPTWNCNGDTSCRMRMYTFLGSAGRWEHRHVPELLGSHLQRHSPCCWIFYQRISILMWIAHQCPGQSTKVCKQRRSWPSFRRLCASGRDWWVIA